MHEMWHYWEGGWQTVCLGIFIAVVIVLGIILVAKNSGKPEKTRRETHETESPLDVLKKRYARGEIDEAEFEQKRRQLEE